MEEQAEDNSPRHAEEGNHANQSRIHLSFHLLRASFAWAIRAINCGVFLVGLPSDCRPRRDRLPFSCVSRVRHGEIPWLRFNIG